MAEAFKDADIVYPKSWASYAAMEERTNLYAAGDKEGIDALEKRLLAQNAQHKDWASTDRAMMKLTKDGKALYLHCLPADITGLSPPSTAKWQRRRVRPATACLCTRRPPTSPTPSPP